MPQIEERFSTLRYQSSETIIRDVDRTAFELETLVEDGPCSIDADPARILGVRDDLERLAARIAAEHPSKARLLRTAAAELNRAADADDPGARFRRVSEALDALEGLR